MSYLDLIPPIKALVFDVDGVLTNGQVVLLPNGGQMRYMHSKDGYALQLAIKKGYYVAIITGGNSQEVKDRLTALGVTDIYLKASDKADCMDEFMMIHNLKSEEVMYMGDDIPDISAMKMIGMPACPADASDDIKPICAYIAKHSGGEGCVREIIEIIMRHQGNWFDPTKHSEQLGEFTW